MHLEVKIVAILQPGVVLLRNPKWSTLVFVCEVTGVNCAKAKEFQADLFTIELLYISIIALLNPIATTSINLFKLIVKLPVTNRSTRQEFHSFRYLCCNGSSLGWLVILDLVAVKPSTNLSVRFIIESKSVGISRKCWDNAFHCFLD